jgi:hypothetical protein
VGGTARKESRREAGGCWQGGVNPDGLADGRGDALGEAGGVGAHSGREGLGVGGGMKPEGRV